MVSIRAPSIPKLNGYRIVKNLQQAELSKTGPGWKPKRLKGAKAAGRAYENKLHKKLKRELLGVGTYLAGQWISFLDENGRGFAQPDGFLIGENVILLFECKLSQTDVAFTQMNKLYAPLLEYLYNLEVIGAQVCKHLRHSAPGIINGLNLHKMENGSTLHWNGN